MGIYREKKVSTQSIEYFKFSLAISIYFVSRLITYRDVGDKFGISNTSAYRVIKDVVDFFFYEIRPDVIRLPAVDEMAELSDLYDEISSLRGTIMAVDGTHLLIDAPNVCQERYLNIKGLHSANCQITVDARCRIWNIFGFFRFFAWCLYFLKKFTIFICRNFNS